MTAAPVPYPDDRKIRLSPTRSGWPALMSNGVCHGYSHNRSPRSAEKAHQARRREDDDLRHATERHQHRRRVGLPCRQAPTRLACRSAGRRRPRSGRPGPPGSTTTVSPTTSGDAAMPQSRFVAPFSSRMFVRHRTRPETSSSARSSPVAPSAYTMPSAHVGVARGPSPPSDSREQARSTRSSTTRDPSARRSRRRLPAGHAARS